MKTVIAIVCFVGACLASAFTAAWFLTVLVSGKSLWPFPSNIIGIELLFAAWGLLMFATAYRTPRPIWLPLLTVSSGRIGAARRLLGLALMNFSVWLLSCIGVWIVRVQGRLPWAFCLLASAAALLNAVYAVVHWALRPENLFSERFRRFADDPVIFLIFDIVLGRRKIR